MTLEHLGKCSFCGSDILFEGKSSLVKCPNCGETMAVATFLNEEIRLEQAQQEAAEAKKALDAAMQAKEAALEEKKEAEQRVFRAITRLEDLSLSQSEQKESLEKLLSGQEASKKETEALHQLLDALYGTQETQQDALTELLSAVLQGQETTDGKLNALQKISETLLQSRDDILSLTQYLKTDSKEKNRLLGQMYFWAKNAGQETVRRLEMLQTGSVTLQSSLNEIDRKIDGLNNRITDVSNQIDRFESSWKQSILIEITGLYDQAESTQRSRDFDQAEQYYREILIKGGKDPEVYWRLILCHYCVEYQEDDDGRWLPTILYPSLDDPRTLQEWKDLSGKCKDSPELLEHYEKLLKPIEEIIRQYCQFRQTVTPQVFICVKQKESTLWTTDSDTGSELYDLVRGYNLSVFNSRRTQIPAGEKYEPFIIAALLSARLMIVVGTSPDRMESRWVKNEWSRFQWLQAKEIKQTGKTDRKLVCYLKGMDPKDIPAELHLDIQAIVESTTSAKVLENLLTRIFPEPKPIPVPTPTPTPFEVVCEQMEIWLEIGEYGKVSQKYANMIDQREYINEPRLHLYALCAKKEVAGFEQLTALKLDLEKEKLFNIARKRAVKQSDKELIEKLLGMNAHPKPPLINSIEIDSRAVRLDHYLENNHSSKDRIHDPDWPDTLVFINDFICRFNLSVRVKYEKPLESNREEIVWQILSENGKPFTSEMRESRIIQPGTVKDSTCLWQYTGKEVWPSGVYAIVITVNGSTPFFQSFRIAGINELKQPEKPASKEQKREERLKNEGVYSNPRTGYEKDFVGDTGAARKWTVPPVAGKRQQTQAGFTVRGIHVFEASEQFPGIYLSDLFVQGTIRQLGIQFDIANVAQAQYATIKWKVVRQDGYVLIPETENQITLKKGDKWIRNTQRLFNINAFSAGIYHVTASCNGKDLATAFSVLNPQDQKWLKDKGKFQSAKLLVKSALSARIITNGSLPVSRKETKQLGVRVYLKKPSTGSDLLVSWFIEKADETRVSARINTIVKIPKGATSADYSLHVPETQNLLKGLPNGAYNVRIFVSSRRSVVESFTITD